MNKTVNQSIVLLLAIVFLGSTALAQTRVPETKKSNLEAHFQAVGAPPRVYPRTAMQLVIILHYPTAVAAITKYPLPL